MACGDRSCRGMHVGCHRSVMWKHVATDDEADDREGTPYEPWRAPGVRRMFVPARGIDLASIRSPLSHRRKWDPNRGYGWEDESRRPARLSFPVPLQRLDRPLRLPFLHEGKECVQKDDGHDRLAGRRLCSQNVGHVLATEKPSLHRLGRDEIDRRHRRDDRVEQRAAARYPTWLPRGVRGSSAARE